MNRKRIAWIALACLFLPLPLSRTVRADTCGQKLEKVRSDVESRYEIPRRRAELVAFRAGLSPYTREEFGALSENFKSLIALPGADMKKLYALQDQARVLVRSSAKDAGYPVLDPDSGSPYDALIEETPELGAEFRSLLVRPDPLPRLTLWAYHQDSAHNPWRMVSIDILPEADQDRASWRAESGKRTLGTLTEFLKAQLPPDCR